MAEKRRPWGKWYWGDWRGDARLRRCSYAARGLWADMLSLMGGECDQYGYLAMEGTALDNSDLARMLGGAEKEVAKLIKELEGKRVFSRVGDADLAPDVIAALEPSAIQGTIISRRMIRDKAKEEFDRANGTGGGNPILKPPDKGGVNPPYKPRVNGSVNGSDKAQTLEARGQKPEALTLQPATSSSSLKDHANGNHVSEIVKEFGGGISVANGQNRYRSQEARDEKGTAMVVELMAKSGVDTPWAIAMSAEDANDPNHEKSCRIMRKWAKEGRIGWVSPERRSTSERAKR